LGTNLLVFGQTRSIVAILGGGAAYGLMYLMALTSNDFSMRKLGKNWKRLHIIGIYYSWLIFFQSYAQSIFLSDPDKWVWGFAFTALLLGALGLRLYLRFGRRAVTAVA
jgi:DMSO/TMAO reductase YedYZ heme-binding membrane subunit